MEEKEENKTELTPIRRAVNWLIANEVIKQDKDLGEKFKLSDGTISLYLKNPPPSFVKRFEDCFSLKLSDFEESLKGKIFIKKEDNEPQTVEIKSKDIPRPDEAEGHSPATLDATYEMYADLKHFLIGMKSNLLTAQIETSSLVQSVLHNQAMQAQTQVVDDRVIDEHFEKSIKMAQMIRKEIYGTNHDKHAFSGS